MQRLLLFAKDVAQALWEQYRTLLRFGAATGPVTVSYIATHRFALVTPPPLPPVSESLFHQPIGNLRHPPLHVNPPPFFVFPVPPLPSISSGNLKP